MGTVVYFTVISFGEMVAFQPMIGGPVGLANVYVDEALAFALGKPSVAQRILRLIYSNPNTGWNAWLVDVPVSGVRSFLLQISEGSIGQ